MELDHEFTVPVPVEQAWQVLLDVERIAPCMPGATLDAAEADEFTGRLKVRLGAMTVTYRGTARIASRDDEAHAVTIEASGKEARGPGTASATVQAQLHEDDGRTRVTVHTKLNVTGRPAQFGRGILAEVGGRLIGRFADNLAAELAGGPEGTETPAAGTPTGAPAEAAETAPETGVRADAPDGAVEAPAEARVEEDAASAATAEEAVEPAGEARRVPPASPTEPAAKERRTAQPASAEPAGAPAAKTPARQAEAEPIDLLEVAGPAVLKRVAPVAAALALLFTVWRLIRRRR